MFFKKLKQDLERMRWKMQALEDENKELKDNLQSSLKIIRRQMVALKKGEAPSERAILEGLPYEKLSGKEAAQMAKHDPETIFLDVRTLVEMSNGHIPGATHIPIDQLAYRIEEMAEYKENPIVAYCASGPRSELACEILLEQGFEKVFKLEGGIGTYPGELEKPTGSKAEGSPTLPSRQRTPDEEEIYQKAKKLISEEINPAVASHGGVIEVLDVRERDIFVRMGGGCQGCGMASATLRQGVEESLRSIIPEMGALYDTTDHASGKNPFYQSH